MSTTKKAIPELRSLLIYGRLWFDKVNGNSYHSVSISGNGKWLLDIGMTYGYEDQYLYTALEALKKFGLVSQDTKSPYELREELDFYTCFRYGPKKELFVDTLKNKKVEDYYSPLLTIEALKNGEF